MTKKYQIFVSSTYRDLEEERQQVIKAILEMGHIPVGMEMFSAADEEQWQIIARQIDDIDYYIIVVAHRYGSVTPDGIGYTEKEYDYAVSKGAPILGFVIDDSAPWPQDKMEGDAKLRLKLNDFKTKIKNRLIQFWKTKEELHSRVSISLMKAITANPRTGWVRADEINGPEVMKELTRLSGENAKLRTRIEELQRTASGHEDEVRRIVRILSSNARSINVRKTSKWEDAEKFKLSLGDIFRYCAPSLINENTNSGIAKNIALNLVGTGYFQNFPIGSNIITEVIADLSSLDLIEPSKKKHSVKDTDDYWSLTKLGNQVLKEFRKVLLEEGLSSVSIEADIQDKKN
ncbi:DUF4062 domain-containing protein [Burkholderia gladioli]|uniref:DUF4062 domain-containing protein n=1 Tax=Burkholderia gladioli TaxID=28095 RepID=UPI001641A7C6|nr:DUF4062 domain-containing protein [Burkholderia gladioli]